MESLFSFSNEEEQKNFLRYLRIRNDQIAFFKNNGWSWQKIGDLMNLHRDYVKSIGHKRGVFGPQRKICGEEPKRKRLILSQTEMAL